MREESADRYKNEFSLVGKFDWVTLFPDGEIGLNPGHKDIGYHSFRYQVTDEHGILSEGAFEVRVIADPRPPIWAANPVNFEAKRGIPFSAEVCSLVSDPDGNPLTITAQNLPKWLTLVAPCRLAGTPQKDDQGSVNFILVATSGNGMATATTITVLKGMTAPTWTANPIQFPSVYANYAVSFDISAFVANPDSLALTFTKISGPAWLMMSANGVITGTPMKSDMGVSSSVVSVSAVGGQTSVSTSVSVIINVLKTDEPPTWKQKKFRLPAVSEGLSFCTDLTPYIKNNDGGMAILTLIQGPAFLTVKDRFVCGNPGKSNIGEVRFGLQVADVKGRPDTAVVLMAVNSTVVPEKSKR